MKMLTFHSIVISTLLCMCIIHRSDGRIEELSADAFNQFITLNKYAIVLFKSSGDCSECNDAADIVDSARQPEMFSGSIEKRFVIDVPLAEGHGISDFPSMIFFRNGVPALYDGKLTAVPELEDWLEIASEVAVKDLYEDNFERLTQASTGSTTGDWFIVFYEQSCSDCLKILPAVESVALSQKHRMNFAKVNVETNTKLAKRFEITECPRSILFRQGKMYEYEVKKYDPKSLVSFVEKWFRNVQAKQVPVEATRFDTLTESIAFYLKEQLQDPSRKWLIVMMIVITTTLLAFVLVCSCKRPEPRAKYD